jgi:hypothetical protein
VKAWEEDTKTGHLFDIHSKWEGNATLTKAETAASREGELRLSKGVGVHRLIYINSNNPVCHTRRRRRARERSQAGDEDSHY